MKYGRILKWGAVAGAGAFGLLATRRARQVSAVPHELRGAGLVASPTFSPLLVRMIRRAMAMRPAAQPPAGVRMTERWTAGSEGTPPVRLVIFERETSSPARPALLWIHGGGYVIGTPEQDMAYVALLLDRLDIAIVSVDYRLAPEHPFPAPLDDCHAALCWLVDHAAELAIDIERIAVGGQSAGGGLAAALVQRATDSGPIAPVFQLLVYPMLDAGTTAKRDHGGRGKFVWTPKSNRFGWASYLGRDPMAEQPDYAVPARRTDLAGLPPAWIGVGSLDLFNDEDVAYGERLRAAGVACDTHVAEGGYHAFDLIKPDAAVSMRFHGSMVAALSRGLGLG